MAETSGPIFHADDRVEAMLDGIEESVARELEALWLANLNASIRVNRGVYVSNINTRRAVGGWVVNDSGVIYGPWL